MYLEVMMKREGGRERGGGGEREIDRERERERERDEGLRVVLS